MKKIAVLLLAVVLFTACASKPAEETPEPVPAEPAPSPAPVAAPEIVSGEWREIDGGYTQFLCNDPELTGNIFVKPFAPANENEYAIEVQKISGNNQGEFGMIFCVNETNPILFYFVGIDMNGYFYIGKRTETEWQEIIAWQPADMLNMGAEAVNTIKVVRDNNDFSVFFNDSETASAAFTDTEMTGTRIGFYAQVTGASYETFPDTPVDVRFK
ncbi:MAG: hypothetical protein LBU99_04025 [Spirochaetaceae bacterium]|jgi:hypothetical protein|nr:hypothetical protein [Spirochaetaceae bacterium]